MELVKIQKSTTLTSNLRHPRYGYSINFRFLLFKILLSAQNKTLICLIYIYQVNALYHPLGQYVFSVMPNNDSTVN